MVEALEPDNRAAPRWLKIECRALEGAIECTIEMDCEHAERVLSLRNTLDDLMISLRASLEAVGEASI